MYTAISINQISMTTATNSCKAQYAAQTVNIHLISTNSTNKRDWANYNCKIRIFNNNHINKHQIYKRLRRMRFIANISKMMKE